jgi:hypothetical protein
MVNGVSHCVPADQLCRFGDTSSESAFFIALVWTNAGDSRLRFEKTSFDVYRGSVLWLDLHVNTLQL